MPFQTCPERRASWPLHGLGSGHLNVALPSQPLELAAPLVAGRGMPPLEGLASTPVPVQTHTYTQRDRPRSIAVRLQRPENPPHGSMPRVFEEKQQTTAYAGAGKLASHKSGPSGFVGQPVKLHRWPSLSRANLSGYTRGFPERVLGTGRAIWKTPLLPSLRPCVPPATSVQRTSAAPYRA